MEEAKKGQEPEDRREKSAEQHRHQKKICPKYVEERYERAKRTGKEIFREVQA